MYISVIYISYFSFCNGITVAQVLMKKYFIATVLVETKCCVLHNKGNSQGGLFYSLIASKTLGRARGPKTLAFYIRLAATDVKKRAVKAEASTSQAIYLI